MKIFGFIVQSIISVLVLASCNSSNMKQTSYSNNNYSTSTDTVVVDSIVDDYGDIPVEYTREPFQEYAPQNAIEKKFISDMHIFSEALNTFHRVASFLCLFPHDAIGTTASMNQYVSFNLFTYYQKNGCKDKKNN